MNNEQFIKIWHEKDTTQDVAEAVGQTYLATSQRASRLRKKGYDLPKKYLSHEEYAAYGRQGGRGNKKVQA